MCLKSWSIEQGDPNKLAQGLIDAMEIATWDFEENPVDGDKRINVINKQY